MWEGEASEAGKGQARAPQSPVQEGDYSVITQCWFQPHELTCCSQACGSSPCTLKLSQAGRTVLQAVHGGESSPAEEEGLELALRDVHTEHSDKASHTKRRSPREPKKE